jgi:hypothetical protein
MDSGDGISLGEKWRLEQFISTYYFIGCQNKHIILLIKMQLSPRIAY